MVVLSPTLGRTGLGRGGVSEGTSPVLEEVEAALLKQLSSAGMTVVPPEDAKMRMIGKAFQNCVQLSCVPKVNAALGADMTLVTTVWLGPSGQASSVGISAQAADGRQVGGSGSVGAEGVTGAVEAALVTVLQRLEVAKLGYLRVRTRPSGASVVVDGEEVGTTPLRRMMKVGTHEVVASKEGYGSRRQRVRVAADEEALVEWHLSEGTEAQSEASAINWALAGALTAVAAPLLVSSIRTLASDGDAAGAVNGEGAANGEAAEEYYFGTRSAVFLGLGSAALLGAGYFAIFQPIRVSVEPSGKGATVGVGGRF